MPEIDWNAFRISGPEDVRDASRQLREIVEGWAPLRIVICHNVASRKSMVDADGNLLAMTVFGWTLEECNKWWHSPRLALQSPVVTACRYENEPFWCNADGFHTIFPNSVLDALHRMDGTREGTIPCAIVVPVHLPFGQLGMASYIPSDRNKSDLSREFEDHGVNLGLLSRYFIAGYVRAMCDRERIPVGAVLSKREVECLRWAAVGKTDRQISLLIERSVATVRFHMQNASIKLDAVNRSQTLFKAAQLGYIPLH